MDTSKFEGLQYQSSLLYLKENANQEVNVSEKAGICTQTI